MLDERSTQLVLALVGLAAFSVLAVSRWLAFRHTSTDSARLFLVDVLLVIVGLELVFDALHEMTYDSGLTSFWSLLAFACRGALISGAIALAATTRISR